MFFIYYCFIVSCKDGLCGNFNEFGGAKNEIIQGFDKQLEDLEKMYAKMIDDNPENREMYMQQLEEQKKKIEEARQEVS